MNFFLLIASIFCSSRVLSNFEIISQQPIPMLKYKSLFHRSKFFTLTLSFDLSGDSHYSDDIQPCDIETFSKHLEVRVKKNKKFFSTCKLLATKSQKEKSSKEYITLGITFDYKWGDQYHFKAFPVIKKNKYGNLEKDKFKVNDRTIEVLLLKVDRKFKKRFKELANLFLSEEKRRITKFLTNEIH